jgi:glutamine phosphoribosylpyrophosphate amidotransferase
VHARGSVFDPNGEVQASRLTFFGLYTLQHRGTHTPVRPHAHAHAHTYRRTTRTHGRGVVVDGGRGLAVTGQEGCGLASNDGSSGFHVHKGMGLVTQVPNAPSSCNGISVRVCVCVVCVSCVSCRVRCCDACLVWGFCRCSRRRR